MSRERVVLIVQARMGSTRLPGKVMKEILGRPMLSFQLERMRRCAEIDDIVVATSERPEEAPLVDLVASEPGVRIFRGPEQDVLARYYFAGREAGATIVVRVTADCPLIEPSVIDQCVRRFREGDADYVSNCHVRTFPRGLDTEVFSMQALAAAYEEALAPEEREHVTPFIWRRPDRFRQVDVVDSTDNQHHRWTVDTAEDLAVVTGLFEALYPTQPEFSYWDALRYCMVRPEVEIANRSVRQKEL